MKDTNNEPSRKRTFTEEEERIINAGVGELFNSDLKNEMSAALTGKGEVGFLESKIINSSRDSQSLAESLRGTQKAKKEAKEQEKTTVVKTNDVEVKRKTSDDMEVLGSNTQRLKQQTQQEEAMAKCSPNGCTIL